jgi:hypothetical protein
VSSFVAAITEDDATLLEADIYELLQAKFEGWEPAEGNLEVWLTKAYVRLASTVRDQAAETSAAIFKKFGETIISLPPTTAVPASVTSTWIMVDDAGYTIDAGTKVAIPVAGDDSRAFEVVEAVTIPPGSNATADGEVLLRSVNPGAADNGLSADADPIDSTPATSAVELIELDGVTSGGVDEEEEDEYLERLKEHLQLISTSLVIASDFEIDTRAWPGVARDKCVPGYNPEDKTTDNPLTVCNFPIDLAGEPLSAPVRAEITAHHEASVPSGVDIFVVEPDYTEVDVTVKVAVEVGYDPSTVVAAVEARLNEYLSPANWGLPKVGDGAAVGWDNVLKVYFLELVSEVDRVGGVNRVVSLQLAEHGDPPGTADVSLAGVAPLARPGDIEVSAE